VKDNKTASPRKPATVSLVSPSLHETPAGTAVPPIIRPLIECGSNPDALNRMLTKIVQSLGFASFTYSAISLNYQNLDSRAFLWSSADSEWLRIYSEQSLVEIDPRQAALNTATPLLWDRATFPNTPQNRAFFDAAERYGQCSGISVAVRDPSPVCAVMFTLSSPVATLEDWWRNQILRELGDILTISSYVHDLCFSGTVARLFSPGIEDAKLSRRELECLQLAAKGLISAEIALALGIGVRTVHYHIANLLTKLEASNRQEAIARAVAAGIIAP
jgi:LuxR family transcriptional regulator, quorum-sensing system regulator LasR